MMAGRVRGRVRWAGLVLVVAAVAGCSTGQGSSRTIKTDSGDQFSVTLPSGWTVEPSDSSEAFLFGKSEGSIFVDEADCAPAVQCGEDKQRVFGGKVTQMTINGLAYQQHSYEADWAGGEAEFYYTDWHDRTYVFTIRQPNDPEVIETVISSVTWQE